ncbi:TolC family protein [Imtechella halotolerans]|nr:TolC family protein [Imtechella halotolerans]WMQ63315.1 TolC family protein [Imtechella halotolerans]
MATITIQSQELDTYLKIAIQNSPQVKAAYSTFEAALQRTPQANALPDPMLTASAFGKMMETRLGAQEARFTLMQTFPWFGTLGAKKEVSQQQAEAAFQNYLEVRNEVLLNVKKLYAELYLVDQTVLLEEKNVNVLEQYRSLALNAFENGKGSMADVLRVDITINKAKTNLALLQSRIAPMKAGFNAMLNRSIKEEVVISSMLPLKPLQERRYDENLFSNNPRMSALQRQLASLEAQQQVVQKEGLPVVGLGVDYSILSKYDTMTMANNGQDAVMPMLSISLPIFRSKYKAKQKEVTFQVESKIHEQEALANSLMATYHMASFEEEQAHKLIALYNKQIQIAQQNLQLLLSAYSNSTEEFNEVLAVQQELLTYQIELISQLKIAFVSQATIEFLLFDNTSENTDEN